MAAVPELFRHFPALRTKLPWTSLARATPVEPFDIAGQGESDAQFWIKRDDKTNDVYGGHEARELEFVFGDALRRGARRLLAFGHVSTTSSLALTMLARTFELEIVLALSGRPRDPRTAWLLEQQRRLGAILHLMHRGPLEAVRLLHTCLTPGSRRGRPRLPVILWPRRAALLETLGAMNGVFELQRQIRCGLLPEPGSIYVGTASLPTLAGLAAGCELAGLRSMVVTTEPRRVGPSRILANRALRALHRQASTVPRTTLRADRLQARQVPHATSLAPEALASLAPGFEPVTVAAILALQTLLTARGGRNPREVTLFWHAEARQRRRAGLPVERLLRASPAHA